MIKIIATTIKLASISPSVSTPAQSVQTVDIGTLEEKRHGMERLNDGNN